MLLEKLIDFINKSDIQLAFPAIRNVELKSNEISVSHSFFIRLSENKLAGNYHLTQIIIFTMLDVIIDHDYPELEGKSFRKRYEGLPQNNKAQRIFKEIYRILKIIRNASIHNRSSLKTSEDNISIQYQHRDTFFELTCFKNAIILINSIVILIAKVSNRYDKYIENVLSSLYNSLIDEIIVFKDDFPEALASIDVDFYFKRGVRYRIRQPEINYCSSTKRYFVKRYQVHENETWASDEYILEENGEKFVIIGELLDNDSSIAEDVLQSWKISPENTLLS